MKKFVFSVCMFFSLWGVWEYFYGVADLVMDRFFLAAIAVVAFVFYEHLRFSKKVIIFGLVPMITLCLPLWNMSWFGIPFDLYLHFLAGVGMGIAFFEYLSRYIPMPAAVILAVCIGAGLGSFVEIMEFVGYSIGGEGQGILFYGPGDFGEWDNAAKDMIANTLGSIIGALVFFTAALVRENKR